MKSDGRGGVPIVGVNHIRIPAHAFARFQSRASEEDETLRVITFAVGVGSTTEKVVVLDKVGISLRIA